jgi:hypothetical protein
MPKKTLKRAIEEGDLESFIKEHEADDHGDLDKVGEVIRRTIQESESEAPQSSSEASSDD